MAHRPTSCPHPASGRPASRDVCAAVGACPNPTHAHHRPTPRASAWRGWLLGGALLAAPCAVVWAAPQADGTPRQRADTRAAVEARYQAERRACLDGSSPQDRSTCLKEASAARAAAQRHQLDNGDNARDRQANALLRCQAQRDAEDRADCERLARGEGTSSGSVAGGGVIRELVTRRVGETGQTGQTGQTAATAGAAPGTPDTDAPAGARRAAGG